MKRLLRVFVLSLALLGSSFPTPIRPEPKAANAETKDCVVYITRTGARYHRGGCRYLRYSAYAISRGEALKRGYTACHVCGGSDCE